MSTSVSSESEAQSVGKSADPLVVRTSRTVAASIGHVWEVLVSRQGAAALLGEGAVLGAKGEPYHCADGTSGVVRSYHPLEQLRVSWHATPDSPPSVVEVDLRAEGDQTVVDLQHEKIIDESLLPGLRERWDAGLKALGDSATA